jgi:hypothetical protein
MQLLSGRELKKRVYENRIRVYYKKVFFLFSGKLLAFTSTLEINYGHGNYCA